MTNLAALRVSGLASAAMLACAWPTAWGQIGGDAPGGIARKEVIIPNPTLDDARRLWPRQAGASSQPAESDNPYGTPRNIDPKHRVWAGHAPQPPAGAVADVIREGTPINFTRGSAAVNPQDVKKIRSYVEALMEDPGHRLLVVGHTDSTGRRSSNIPLSNRRAESVRMVMISLGADGARIRTLGKGSIDPNPDLPNDDPLQRRVEFEGQ